MISLLGYRLTASMSIFGSLGEQRQKPARTQFHPRELDPLLVEKFLQLLGLRDRSIRPRSRVCHGGLLLVEGGVLVPQRHVRHDAADVPADAALPARVEPPRRAVALAAHRAEIERAHAPPRVLVREREPVPVRGRGGRCRQRRAREVQVERARVAAEGPGVADVTARPA